MKLEITSLDLYYIVADLQSIVDTRIDKVYHKEDTFLITGHKPGFGKVQLRIRFPSLLFLTAYKESFPKVPSGFSMFLRKRLSHARITDIKQHGFQRVLVIALKQRDKVSQLVIELFGEGNIILCDDRLKIIYPYKTEIWSDRAVRGGIPYVFPVQAFDARHITRKELTESFGLAKKSISGFLAKELAFGKWYAANICAEAGVDSKSQKLNEEEIACVFKAIQSQFTKRLDPVAYEGHVSMFPLEGMEGKHFPKPHELLDDVVGMKELEAAKESAEKKQRQRENKFQKIITSQTKILESLESGERTNQRKGELLYEHYGGLEKLYARLEPLVKKKDWDGITKLAKATPFVKKFEKKNTSLVLELNDGQ